MASHPLWGVMCALSSCLLGQMTWLRTPPLPFTSCENLRGSFNPLKSHLHIKQAKSMMHDFKTDETGERFIPLPGM